MRQHAIAFASGLALVMVSLVGWMMVELYQRDNRQYEISTITANSVTEIRERITNNEERLERTNEDIDRLRDVMNTFIERLPDRAR